MEWLLTWIKRKPLIAYFLRKVNNNYWEVVGKTKVKTLGPVLRWKGRDYILKLDSSTVVEYPRYKAVFYSVDNATPLSIGEAVGNIDPELLNKIVNTQLWGRLLSIGKLEAVSIALMAVVGLLGFMLGMYIDRYITPPEYINATTTITITKVVSGGPG